MSRIKKIQSSLILIFTLMCVGLLAWYLPYNGVVKLTTHANLNATVIDTPFPVSDFFLISHNKKVFSDKSFLGKWSFVFFGFTNCPDVCPTTLTTMQQVWENINSQKKTPSNLKQLIFVSVDPNRDLPKLLKRYIENYHRDFIGVTGPLLEISKLSKQLGVAYAYNNQGKTDGSYTMEHAAQVYLIDPTANLRAIFTVPHNAKDISNDYLTITNL